MCGIVAYTGREQAAPVLLEGLRRLEYRGYDSAGVAIVNGSRLAVRKTEGRLEMLARLLEQQPVPGFTGIGHTRWATHGRPAAHNAHPHLDCTGRVPVVHNGIIHNFRALRHELSGRGHRFLSETDRSEEHTSELQSRENLVCRLLLEKKKNHIEACSSDHDLPARNQVLLALAASATWDRRYERYSTRYEQVWSISRWSRTVLLA